MPSWRLIFPRIWRSWIICRKVMRSRRWGCSSCRRSLRRRSRGTIWVILRRGIQPRRGRLNTRRIMIFRIAWSAATILRICSVLGSWHLIRYPRRIQNSWIHSWKRKLLTNRSPGITPTAFKLTSPKWRLTASLSSYSTVAVSPVPQSRTRSWQPIATWKMTPTSRSRLARTRTWRNRRPPLSSPLLTKTRSPRKISRSQMTAEKPHLNTSDLLPRDLKKAEAPKTLIILNITIKSWLILSVRS